MGAETIFYTPVAGSVISALNARKAIYMSENRSEGAHNWLHKKMAFATATASNPLNGRGANLAISRKGGLKKGLYRNDPSDDGSSKHFPKPHLTSIKISAEGDFGSIRKCELAFTVYTLPDLDAKQAFFDLGANLGLTWGWNEAGGAGGPSGRFQGKIYNFTYSVNAQGGFDCITYGMEEGVNIFGGNADAPTDESAEITDPLGNVIKSNNIFETAKGWLVSEAEGLTEGVTASGIGVAQFPSDWGNDPAKSTSKGDAPTAPEGEPEAQYYISLEAIVKLINKLAFDNAPDFFGDSGVGIKCDGTVTKGLVPSDTTRLVSANPLEVLFPGYSTYSPDRTFAFGEYDAAFTGGDLSKAMISMNWFKEHFGKLGKKDSKTGKSPDSSIGTFLQDIFTLIFKNSGDRFKLTAVTKPGSQSGTEILIVDANYIETETAPYSLTAVTQGSIVRTMSLTAKIPSEMATAAMIANSSSYTSNKSAPVFGAGQKGKTQEKAPETLEQAKLNIASQFVTPDNVKALEAALRRDQSGDNGATNGKEAIPFPLDYSVTLDGIEGFVFGNVITTNYLPSVYKSPKVKLAFTVTKVNHNIAGGDWTTTLNTVCRVIS